MLLLRLLLLPLLLLLLLLLLLPLLLLLLLPQEEGRTSTNAQNNPEQKKVSPLHRRILLPFWPPTMLPIPKRKRLPKAPGTQGSVALPNRPTT